MKINQRFKSILIISDSYIPEKISAAGMIYNLSKDLCKRGLKVTCAFSGNIDLETKENYSCNQINFVTTNIFKNFRKKSLILRFIYEVFTALILSFKVCFFFKRKEKVDLIIWYGPSVFLWLVVWSLNRKKKIPVYYILRDIFPDWLIFLKVIKNPIIIWLLKFITNPQYNVSDIIGVETNENVFYLQKKLHFQKKIELLNNWPNIIRNTRQKIDDIVKIDFNIHIKKYAKQNSINLLYLGNSSVAHDYESIVYFLNSCGNYYGDLKYNLSVFGNFTKIDRCNNNMFKQKFWGLVSEYNIPYILSRADCGVVSLNRNAKTHNIPGKFISYVQFGLPIICFASIRSPLAKLIIKYDCGIVIDLDSNAKDNISNFLKFIKNFNKKKIYFSRNSYNLFIKNFDTQNVNNQILKAFN